MDTKTYTAKTPIKHDEKDYAVGDLIELDDKTEAPQLILVYAIEETPAKKAAAK